MRIKVIRFIVTWVVGAVAINSVALAQTTLPATTQPGITQPAKALAIRPDGPVAADQCVTCHANVRDYKIVHGPVNVNACDACHKLVDAKEHKYELARGKAETCTFCHQVDTTTMPVVHKPVADGQCLSCHNPHGGSTPKFIRTKTSKELCNTCHQDVMAGKGAVHGPVAAGACDACHQSHASKNPKLLIAAGRDLCFTCHTEMKTQMTQVKFTHKAVEQDCITCHDPHASNFVMQTRQEPLKLCTSCHEHEKMRQAAMDAPRKHSPVVTDKACLNCHTAHGGNLSKLMRADPLKVCMKCHNEPVNASDGRKVASVAEILDPTMNKHGPIRDGNCGGCHDAHGSPQPKLLVKAYPETFYQPFSIDKYDLCFTCHDKQLVTTEKTSGLTGFRNGQRNLHFVHVNKLDRGRSCRACHESHASAQPLHVRDSVPYGNWKMPINFKRTEAGGSCAPGCHKEFGYNRNNPVEIPAAGPASAPSGVADKDRTP